MLRMLPLFFLFICTFFAEAAPMNTAPYGSWTSPITAEAIASGAIQFSEIHLSHGTVYWLERRPTEKGRTALMSWSEEEGERELLPKEYNLRSRVHEYGGGALLVDASRIFFVNDSDQQVYRFEKQKIDRITSRSNARFADGSASGSFLFYVMEEHGSQTVNSIVKIDLTDKTIVTIASGRDFYSNPRVSRDGRLLTYLCWDHPNMPWDGTELWTLDLKTGEKQLVAGGPTESVADPSWSPSDRLHYISDRTGWWNLYAQGDSASLYAMTAEFAQPQWTFGQSLYGFDKEKIACSFIVNGYSKFGAILSDQTLRSIDLPYSSIIEVSIQGGRAALIASSPEEPYSILLFDLKTGHDKIVKRSSPSFPNGFLSKPQFLSFPSKNGRTAFAFYYPPANPHFQATKGEKPPLLVHSHGGPTAYDPPCFRSNALYWTSRGFAFMTVNFGGSTGYGRAYRDLLKGQWGVVDIEDCTEAALYCVKQGLADPNRLGIEGGSSGGYTTLEALSSSRTFHVGADYFGVSDLERLALDTHKFESHYLDQLIGPYPEEKALYDTRSPIDHADRIQSPVIIFQGDEDPIVPPSQSEEIYQSLVERKIPTAYLLFQGEQHGFRKAENIQRSLEAQLYFFSKILGFPLDEKIPPVEINNLK
jgi:dipeptidyl aminopeptidase/acylaminoacyl peptidase